MTEPGNIPAKKPNHGQYDHQQNSPSFWKSSFHHRREARGDYVRFPPIADGGWELQHAAMTWNSVEQRIQELGPNAEHCGNLSDLVAALNAAAPPREVTKNAYNDSISLHWEGFEIETHADRFETYEISESGTQIQHWPHVPGAAIAADLLSKVTTAAG